MGLQVILDLRHRSRLSPGRTRPSSYAATAAWVRSRMPACAGSCLAPFGLGVGGLPMVAVPVVGSEPPIRLFLLAVVPIFVGLIAVGVLGTKRVWPWWTGVAVALVLPMMVLLLFNNLFMAAVDRIVQGHGGSLTLLSGRDVGTTARIVLPTSALGRR